MAKFVVGQRVTVTVGRTLSQNAACTHHQYPVKVVKDENGTPWHEIQVKAGETATIVKAFDKGFANAKIPACCRIRTDKGITYMVNQNQITPA